MNYKYFIQFWAFMLLANWSLAASMPASIALSTVNSQDEISVTFKVQNAKTITDIKFNGLDDFAVRSREIALNTSSENESNNNFSSKLSLLPTKAESATIYVTAQLDGKPISSNKVNITITAKQLTAFKERQQQQLQAQKKQQQELEKQFKRQIQAQQQFFANVNELMLKQQSEMLKAQNELAKHFESEF